MGPVGTMQRHRYGRPLDLYVREKETKTLSVLQIVFLEILNPRNWLISVEIHGYGQALPLLSQLEGGIPGRVEVLSVSSTVRLFQSWGPSQIMAKIKVKKPERLQSEPFIWEWCNCGHFVCKFPFYFRWWFNIHFCFTMWTTSSMAETVEVKNNEQTKL